jgi:hypothetical protein
VSRKALGLAQNILNLKLISFLIEKGHVFRVLLNKLVVLRRIFGHKEREVTCGRRKLHKKQIHYVRQLLIILDF